jgi:heme/copper-type cytochrome/quinol oxidase subunit 2
VLWENVGLKPGIKFWRKALTAVVLAILILIGFSLLLLMKKKLKLIQPSSNDPETDHYVSIIISFLASTFVALINTTLGIFIRKFARYERHKTQSNYFVSTGRRLTACLVINMCFTTVLANMVHSEKAESIFTFWRISVTGLFFDIFFLFVTNSYMSSIFNIFDLLWVFRIIKRYRA